MDVSNVNDMQGYVKCFYCLLRISWPEEGRDESHGLNADILFAEYTDCQYAVKTAGQKANAG
jgi:hypothetical protein